MGWWRRRRIPYGYRARGFRARSWRAGTGWTTRSRGTRLGRGDRSGRLTGRLRGRLLGWLCLLIRRLLIRRLLRLRRAATCGASGSRAARLRWTNCGSGTLRPAATSSSCAARTRRCNLLFAGALPVGSLVLLVRRLSRSYRHPVRPRASDPTAPRRAAAARASLRRVSAAGVVERWAVEPGLRTADPGLRIPTLRASALGTTSLRAPALRTPT